MRTTGTRCTQLFIASCLSLMLINCSDNVTGQGTALGLDCDVLDLFNPVFESTLTQELPAALTRSPQYSWTAAADFCGVDHYEYSIGTTIEGEELIAWTDIGNVTVYRAESLPLVDAVTYYMSFRALDGFGNISEVITSPGWQRLDPVRDLPNLILRLNALDLASVLDSGGRNPNQGGFNNSVQQWLDTSGSTNVHNWYAETAGNRPDYVSMDNTLQFNGIDQFLTVNDHDDLNTGTVNQRNFSVAFETSNDIASTQVVYEEGAGVRGMNVYISGGNVYCGFYNTANDGDGAQGFVSVSAPIAQNTRYSVTWVFDYLNYTGPAGPDGTLTCYLSGTQIGQTTSTSLLYAHSGDLGLGAKNDSTYYHTGASSGTGDFFEGKIMEVMIVESVPTPAELILIEEYLSDKWNIP